MKSFRLMLLLGIAACAIPATRAENTPTADTDFARLQGVWSMVSGVADGFVLSGPMLKNSKRTCEADVTTVIVDGQLLMKAQFTLNPAKTPKTIDYLMLEGVTKGKIQLGIYELDGETVKFCFGEPGGARPAEFGSKPGDRRTSAVWKRATTAAPQPEKK